MTKEEVCSYIVHVVLECRIISNDISLFDTRHAKKANRVILTNFFIILLSNMKRDFYLYIYTILILYL